MTMRVTRSSDGAVLGDRIRVAATFWQRFRGLMLVPALEPGEGLLLEPCTSIHMMFMKFPIDAVFLDAENRVLKIYPALPPWTGCSGWHRQAAKVLELPAGTAAPISLVQGDQLNLERMDLQ